ncbi:rRNA maturation RNase YbeY [Dolosicoccus paucivorans]|uniref:Endoribonuclease YbeY n=1 Tax=Dolosicoccus paucivorans TaxID=84521 RepID=A0A2N6SMZ4_9LACT|nr:rRNA maturation RNase YbeY [Dolosicoccus paucivorans]PMB84338.1 rRNA maturation RNase YbeY [Dolosicoccus paucivorans]PMC58453.1 rRNA maturation RNase YbeY [Dolosicoccus paucivorans]
MSIEIIDELNYLQEADYQMIQSLIEQSATYLKLDSDFEVDISLVDNEQIQELNATYRQIDRPTDVLSFALNDQGVDEEDWMLELEEMSKFLGDIIISIPKAKEQAKEYNHSFERELGFLVVHGFLHLNGYDHETEEERQEMFAIQEKILNAYGLTR